MALTEQQKKAVRFLANNAARDPKFNDAIKTAFDAAIDNPDTEARMWCDNVGEFALARDVLTSVMKEHKVSGVTLKEIKHDDEKMTLAFELSNGSAVVLGLKQFRLATVLDDAMKMFRL